MITAKRIARDRYVLPLTFLAFAGMALYAPMAMAAPQSAATNRSATQNTQRATHGRMVTITGRIKAVNGNTFTLDSADNDIVVDTGGLNLARIINTSNSSVSNAANAGRGPNATPTEGTDTFLNSLNDKHVAVIGPLDDSLFDNKRMKAKAIYIGDTHEFFYSGRNTARAGQYAYPIAAAAENGDWIGFEGKVKSIDGDNTLTLGTAAGDIKVKTGNTEDNPLNNGGRPKLRQGEIVSVYGKPEDDLFRKRQLQANSIIVLTPENRAS